jgi:transposase
VKRFAERTKRLEKALDEAIERAPMDMREVIAALQSPRGAAKMIAVTIVAEVGQLSRFTRPKEWMRGQRACAVGSIERRQDAPRSHHQDGNSHLRRVLVEAAWPYRFRPVMYAALRGPASAQRRFRKLTVHGKPQPQVVTRADRSRER